jgi:hypothetical protein
MRQWDTGMIINSALSAVIDYIYVSYSYLISSFVLYSSQPVSALLRWMMHYTSSIIISNAAVIRI